MDAGTSFLMEKYITTSNSAAISKPAEPPSAPSPIRKSFSKLGLKTGPTVCPDSTACLPSPSGTHARNASSSLAIPSVSSHFTTPTIVVNFSLPPNFVPFSVTQIFGPASIPLPLISTSPSAISPLPPPPTPGCASSSPAKWSPGHPQVAELNISGICPLRIILLEQELLMNPLKLPATFFAKPSATNSVAMWRSASFSAAGSTQVPSPPSPPLSRVASSTPSPSASKKPLTTNSLSPKKSPAKLARNIITKPSPQGMSSVPYQKFIKDSMSLLAMPL